MIIEKTFKHIPTKLIFVEIKEFQYWVVFNSTYKNFYLTTCGIDATKILIVEIPEIIKNHLEDPLFELMCIKLWEKRTVKFTGEETNWCTC